MVLGPAPLWRFALIGFAYAQLSFNPHSGYGWGYTHAKTASSQAGMGRLSTIGLGMSLPDQPAHSAHLRGTQLDFSGYGRQATVRSATDRILIGTGSLQNLLLSFSAGKGWGFAMGLTPEAVSGYRSRYVLTQPVSYFATDGLEGLLTQAYIQVAFRWKAIALGYQFGYLRGNYERTQSLQLSIQSLPDYLLSSLRFRGLAHTTGLMLQDSVGDLWYQVGVQYRFRTALSGWNLYTLQKALSLTSLIVDTLALQNGQQGYYPTSYRGGVALGRKSWMIGIEGGYQEAPPAWDRPGFWSSPGRPSWDLRFGVEWLPDPRSTVFYKRLRYQVGGYRQSYPYAEPVLYAGTVGLGWTFPRSASVCYITAEYGSLPHPRIRETYWQISVGVAFREQWFLPPRID